MDYIFIIIVLLFTEFIFTLCVNSSTDKYVICATASGLIFMLALGAFLDVNSNYIEMRQNTIDALNGDLKYDTLTLDKTDKLVEIKILKE